MVYLTIIYTQLYDAYLLPVLLLSCISLFLIALFYLARYYRRRKASKHFGLQLASSIIAKPLSSIQRIGTFTLSYPVWAVAKKDGTRDLRTNNHRIIRDFSILLVDKWSLRCKDPFQLYRTVLSLRKLGYSIELCSEEAIKRDEVLKKLEDRAASNDLTELVQRFSSNPVEFEHFCADVFIQLGWDAEVTPPRNDGGYDIVLSSTDGIEAIVECKCYSSGHSIGRPAIQKLKGANVSLDCDKLYFVTTSSYSKEAVAYAKEAGVTLIDGPELIQLCKRAFGSHSKRNPATIDYVLTSEDIRSHYPKDMH